MCFLTRCILDAIFCAAFCQSSAVHVWGRIWCCCPETRTETFQHMYISHHTKAYECANWAQVTTVKHAGWLVFSLTHSGLVKQQNVWLALYHLAKNNPLIDRKRTCLFCLYMPSCVTRCCFNSLFEVIITNLLHSSCWKEIVEVNFCLFIGEILIKPNCIECILSISNGFHTLTTI